MMWRLWVVWLGVLLSGCAGVEVKHYAAQQPALHLEQFFNGRVEAWGMFQKRNGEVVKRFQVQIDASWQGERGILDESFRYSDGSTQRRVWQLTRVAQGRYVGRADDVEGDAVGVGVIDAAGHEGGGTLGSSKKKMAPPAGDGR